MSHITAILVAELPAMRNMDGSVPVTTTAGAPGSGGRTGGGSSPLVTSGVQPRSVLILPPSEASRLPHNVLSFCFPDLDQLHKMPYHWDHVGDEFVFTITSRDAPRLHGFVRRYRVSSPAVGNRLDLSPYTSHNAKVVSSSPAWQCICILSERPYHKFFSQCLQLLHAARLAGGPVAMTLARALLAYNAAPAGATLLLRSLLNAPKVPGCLPFSRERLRLPPSVGLPYFDVPLSPLLHRLDAPAIMLLYAAMLCERRIVFVSQSIPTLTSCVHAGMALFQPFEWLHIFIPILSSSLLMYCTAPNPYIIGLTPAQFTQLNEEYEIGDIVLVALDEGYVACLNSALPLVDLEGASAANNNTGFVSYAGPRVVASSATAASGLGTAVGSGDSTPGSGGGGFLSYFSSTSTTSPLPGGVAAPGGATAMSPAGGPPSPMAHDVSFPASSSVGGTDVLGDALLQPWHSSTRTHAYDDEFIKARALRRLFAARRLQSRRKAKERIARIFERDVNVAAVASCKAAAAAARRGASHGSSFFHLSALTEGAFAGGGSFGAAGVGVGSGIGGPGGEGTGWGTLDETVGAGWTPTASIGRNSGVNVPVFSPGGATHAPSRPAVPVTPTGAAELAAAARRSGLSATTATSHTMPETELDGSLSAEIGTCTLGVDLVALVSRPGDEDSVRRRKAAAARRVAALPAELAGLDMAAMATKKDTSKSLAARVGLKSMTAALGSAWMAGLAMATGSTSDDPGVMLAGALRRVYERERKEGAFDEAAVYAAVLGFVAVVFGRVPEFVHEEGVGGGGTLGRAGHPPTHPGAPVAGGREPRFAKEEFVRFTARHATVVRLLDEAQHSQWLQTFAAEQYLRAMAKTRPESGSGTTPSGTGVGGAPARIHIVDMLMMEARDAAAAGPPGTSGTSTGSIGRGLATSSIGRGGSGVSAGNGGTSGSLSGGAAALMGAAPVYGNLVKKLYATLQPLLEPLTDLPAGALGSGAGVAGSPHTVRTVLTALGHQSMLPAYFPGRPATLPPTIPDVTTSMVVTALRGLLSAATSSSQVPEEAHNNIVRIAAAATHDPHLLHVVLGTLWARINDCADRHWQHGYKALALLAAVLRLGSPRLVPMSLVFIPLLRFLIHPTRALAVRAGFVAEELGGQASHTACVQSANVLIRARKGMFGAAAIPGLPLSTAVNPLSSISPREGGLMVARQAARVYLLLSCPDRWLVERAAAIGPAAIMHGYPLPHPFPYPLIQPVAILAPADCALPYGWLPTAREPVPPSGSTPGANSDDGRSVSRAMPNAITRQDKAATAPWETVHKVSQPPMALRHSRALASMAATAGMPPGELLGRPACVAEAIRAARDRKASDNPATSGRGTGAHRFRTLGEVLTTPVSLLAVLPTVVSGDKGVTFAVSFGTPTPAAATAVSTSTFDFSTPPHRSGGGEGGGPLFNPFATPPFGGPVPAREPGAAAPASEFDDFKPVPAAAMVPAASDFDSWATTVPAPTTAAPASEFDFDGPVAIANGDTVNSGGSGVRPSDFDTAPAPTPAPASTSNRARASSKLAAAFAPLEAAKAAASTPAPIPATTTTAESGLSGLVIGGVDASSMVRAAAISALPADLDNPYASVPTAPGPALVYPSTMMPRQGMGMPGAASGRGIAMRGGVADMTVAPPPAAAADPFGFAAGTGGAPPRPAMAPGAVVDPFAFDIPPAAGAPGTKSSTSVDPFAF